jgi:hypothetical protein
VRVYQFRHTGTGRSGAIYSFRSDSRQKENQNRPPDGARRGGLASIFRIGKLLTAAIRRQRGLK